MMSTRRTFLTFGVLLASVVLLVPGTAFAQDLTTSDVPTSIAARSTGTDSLVVTWSPPSANGASVDQYEVAWAEKPSVLGETATTAAQFALLTSMKSKVGDERTSMSITGLKAGTTYTVSVRAIDATPNPDLVSDWGGPADEATDDLPAVGKVMDLRLTEGDGMIMAEWDPVSDPIGIHHYKVTTTAAGGFSLIMGTDGNVTMHTVMNLTNGIEYTIKVAAVAMNQDGSADADGDGTPERLGPDSDAKKATPMAGAGGDMTVTPALPLFGILALFGGLLAAGRARLRR